MYQRIEATNSHEFVVSSLHRVQSACSTATDTAAEVGSQQGRGVAVRSGLWGHGKREHAKRFAGGSATSTAAAAAAASHAPAARVAHSDSFMLMGGAAECALLQKGRASHTRLISPLFLLFLSQLSVETRGLRWAENNILHILYPMCAWFILSARHSMQCFNEIL